MKPQDARDARVASGTRSELALHRASICFARVVAVVRDRSLPGHDDHIDPPSPRDENPHVDRRLTRERTVAMHPSVMAMEGWVWARAARRRVASGSLSPQSQVAEADCLADLGQGIEAIDRAIRYADHVLKTVTGTALPGGVDWSRLRQFARRGRDALAHGDERLTSPGFGYSLRISAGVIYQHGKAKGEKQWRTDAIDLRELADSVDALVSWLEREASII
jgi:hypothetical protein